MASNPPEPPVEIPVPSPSPPENPIDPKAVFPPETTNLPEEDVG